MKIICIGRNYADHAKELGNLVPTRPLIFMKPPSALLVNDKPFYYPDFSEDVHYELEVVLKIGKNGRHIQADFAESYITEIGLGIDFTARDLQRQCKEKGHPWEIAKGFDHSAVLGKFVPVKDVDLSHIQFELRKNAEVVQQGDTRELIFSFGHLIQYASQYFRLQMGDLIYTGTPAGVGPVQQGDLLEGFLQIDGKLRKMLHCEIR